MQLNHITPPHDPTDSDKLASIVSAYEHDQQVRPFVVVEFPTAALAISGSHRIAAAKTVFEEDTDVAECGLAIVIDGDELAAEMQEDSVATQLLEDLRNDRVSRYGDLVDALWQYLPPDARDALADQR